MTNQKTVSETKIEHYLRDKLKVEPNCLCLKFESKSLNGIPDRIIFYNGYTYLVETKAPGKNLRRNQVSAFRKLYLTGQAPIVIDSIEKVDIFLKLLKLNLKPKTLKKQFIHITKTQNTN